MIRVKNLTKSYVHKGKRIIILDNISFNINKGESIALVGGNGSGKSTLLRILGGIDLPDSGEIEKECSVSWPVGFSAGFQGSLSAKDNVTFVSRIYSSNDREQIKEKVEFVRKFADIGDYFYLPYKSYSSGMRARVSFALSIAFEFEN